MFAAHGYLAREACCAMPSIPLADQLVQICPFTVKLFTRMGEGVLQPVCNDRTSIAMTTPFNRDKLEALAYLDSKGQGEVAGVNCRMDKQIFHGQNIRFCVCMDGAVKLAAKAVPTDKLDTQTVVYANTKTSLDELMFLNGQPRRQALCLQATSSDEGNSSFVLQLTPRATQAHYSATNVAHVASISAQHLSSTVIARALFQCQEKRREALVACMQKTSGVAQQHTNTFYMCLLVGSLFDVSTGEQQECTVDVTQWHALIDRSSAMLAESHVFKLCEAMVMMLTHSVASMGVDIASPAAVLGFMQSCDASTEGRAWLGQVSEESLRTANEGSFKYTSDSEIKGFAVRNREGSVFLEAQMTPTVEKQNLIGMDPLMSWLHLEHSCDALETRTRAALALTLETAPAAEHAAAQAASAAVLGRVALHQANYDFRADCEDAVSCLAGVAKTAAHMDLAHLASCVDRVMLSAAFAADARALTASVQTVLPFVRGELAQM